MSNFSEKKIPVSLIVWGYQDIYGFDIGGTANISGTTTSSKTSQTFTRVPSSLLYRRQITGKNRTKVTRNGLKEETFLCKETRILFHWSLGQKGCFSFRGNEKEVFGVKVYQGDCTPWEESREKEVREGQKLNNGRKEYVNLLVTCRRRGETPLKVPSRTQRNQERRNGYEEKEGQFWCCRPCTPCGSYYYSHSNRDVSLLPS